MIDISSLERITLKEYLKELQLFASLKKTLWKRWHREYERIKNGKNYYAVEYYDFNGKKILYFQKKAVVCFKIFFWIDLTIDQIQCIPNKNIQWGMRIIFNDTLYDLSYQRFEKLLK
jgi:hypothetical protein